MKGKNIQCPSRSVLEIQNEKKLIILILILNLHHYDERDCCKDIFKIFGILKYLESETVKKHNSHSLSYL
jgi:hypothetical protein